MFDVTVTAKFLTHAKIKIHRTVANAFLNVCEKIRRFLSRIKNVQKRKWCIANSAPGGQHPLRD